MQEFDAAAPAPAIDDVSATQPEMTDGDAMAAVWDRLNADEAEAPQEEPQEAQAEAAEAEPPAPADLAPSDLPLAVKNAWQDLPPDARDAVSRSHREMTQKLAEQGRLVQGIAPIRDVLIEATRSLPNLASMTPQQAASEIMQLAQFSAQLQAKPAETILAVMDRYGVREQVSAALSGQPAAQYSASLQNEIRSLKTQLAQVADPNYLREQVSAVTAQERAMNELQTFSAKAEHWAEVEPHLIGVIPLAQGKLGPGASNADVLKAAYDMALAIYLPDAKASNAAAAQKAPAVSDPKTVAAVANAKSVNVTSRPSGQPRELTERQALAAAYERAMSK
jgi:hypothetical protein